MPRFCTIFLYILFITINSNPGTSACSCPKIPYSVIFATTRNVVKAIVTSSKKVPGKTPPIYLFTLRTIKVFKGCNPRIFKARSILFSGICGVVLKKGLMYRINLGRLRARNDFFKCFDTKPWRNVSIMERRFLKREKERGSNKCRGR